MALHPKRVLGVKVHLAFGYIDMRKRVDGLAMLAQDVLRQDGSGMAPAFIAEPRYLPHMEYPPCPFGGKAS